MLEIELNKKENDYLYQIIIPSASLKNLSLSNQQSEDKYLLSVTQNQAEEIRDLCGERLQVVGFDQKYELTSEGVVLTSLIDKFFGG